MTCSESARETNIEHAEVTTPNDQKICGVVAVRLRLAVGLAEYGQEGVSTKTTAGARAIEEVTYDSVTKD